MTDPERTLGKPSAWWGTIQAGVRQRQSTAELWESIRAFGEANGVTYPPGMFQEVNRIRAEFGALRNASERLGRAAPGDAITSAMLAPLPYSRSGPEQALAQQYHVRVGYTARQGSETASSYITLSYSGDTLPQTVGDLYADAELATAATVDTYGGELIGLEGIEVGSW